MLSSRKAEEGVKRLREESTKGVAARRNTREKLEERHLMKNEKNERRKTSVTSAAQGN